jgi:hypothetical protein
MQNDFQYLALYGDHQLANSLGNHHLAAVQLSRPQSLSGGRKCNYTGHNTSRNMKTVTKNGTVLLLL